MIKISKDKVEHLAETAEKMLRYGGKLMQCLEEMKEEEGYGERGGYGMRRGGYGMRDEMSYRYPMNDEMPMRDDEEFGERRGRNSMGRFTHM